MSRSLVEIHSPIKTDEIYERIGDSEDGMKTKDVEFTLEKDDDEPNEIQEEVVEVSWMKDENIGRKKGRRKEEMKLCYDELNESPLTDDLLTDEPVNLNFLDHVSFHKEHGTMMKEKTLELPEHIKELAEKTHICVICTEFMKNNLSATLCGHVFHRDCLLKWFSSCTENHQDHVCPLCRHLQKGKPIHLFIHFDEDQASSLDKMETSLDLIKESRLSILSHENQNLLKMNDLLKKQKSKLSQYVGELVTKNLQLKHKLKGYRQKNIFKYSSSTKQHPSEESCLNTMEFKTTFQLKQDLIRPQKTQWSSYVT
jgi:rubrerythrin